MTAEGLHLSASFISIGKAAVPPSTSPTDLLEKEFGKDWNSVIEGALDLVIRLEKDRQDTLHKLGTCTFGFHAFYPTMP